MQAKNATNDCNKNGEEINEETCDKIKFSVIDVYITDEIDSEIFFSLCFQMANKTADVEPL